ncbi:MAG: hypothetical protein U0930_15150 [Pirellulales bacterium]
MAENDPQDQLNSRNPSNVDITSLDEFAAIEVENRLRAEKFEKLRKNSQVLSTTSTQESARLLADELTWFLDCNWNNRRLVPYERALLVEAVGLLEGIRDGRFLPGIPKISENILEVFRLHDFSLPDPDLKPFTPPQFDVEATLLEILRRSAQTGLSIPVASKELSAVRFQRS